MVDSLLVIQRDGSQFSHILDTDKVIIGRSSSADLSLADNALSRRHAVLSRSAGQWVIKDLGSRNGTFVNSRRVEGRVDLEEGDVITLGSCSAEYSRTGGIEAGPSEAPTDHSVFRPAAEILAESGHAALRPLTVDRIELERLADRLQILTRVHHALDQSVSLDELMELILDRIFEHLHPEEGAIFLRGADGSFVETAQRSSNPSDQRSLNSRSLLREVAEKGHAALVLDTELDMRFAKAESLLGAGVRSLVAAPLLGPAGPIGMIVLGSTLNVRRFGKGDMDLLVSLASVAAMRISNVRLTDESEERRQLKREVGLARSIQVALLPSTIPQPNGFEIHAGNIPSRGVSGDFYKVLERSNGSECVILLADVSGKGIAASLLTASLEALSAGPMEAGSAPEEICDAVSRQMYVRTPPEKFATALLAVLDVASGRIRFSNAGHNPAIVVRADSEVEWLQPTGMPLGILPSSTYTANEFELRSGDLLVIYTDGITEAEDPDEEEYGVDRLRRVCTENHTLSLPELSLAIEEDVESFARGVRPADDRTLVMIRSA